MVLAPTIAPEIEQITKATTERPTEGLSRSKSEMGAAAIAANGGGPGVRLI